MSTEKIIMKNYADKVRQRDKVQNTFTVKSEAKICVKSLISVKPKIATVSLKKSREEESNIFSDAIFFMIEITMKS